MCSKTDSRLIQPDKVQSIQIQKHARAADAETWMAVEYKPAACTTSVEFQGCAVNGGHKRSKEINQRA